MAPRSYPKSPVFWELVRLEKELMRLPESDRTLSDNRLKSMNIERAPQLDIDNLNAVDAFPVFFEPLADSPNFRNAVAETERKDCGWPHCPHEATHNDRLSCAVHAIDWLDGMLSAAVDVYNLYPADAPKWKRGCYGDYDFPSYSACDEYIKKHRERPLQPLPEWFIPVGFWIESQDMHHAMYCLADNTPHGHRPNEALRSEITAGVSLIRRQMQTAGTSVTIPVLVLSVYHNETARITQVCWNGERNPITFRQSRLLNIASKSFATSEVLLLLRWMTCIPLHRPKASRRQATAAPAVAPPGFLSDHQSGTPESNIKANSSQGAVRANILTSGTRAMPDHREPSVGSVRASISIPAANKPATPQHKRPGTASESSTTTSSTSSPSRAPAVVGRPPNTGGTIRPSDAMARNAAVAASNHSVSATTARQPTVSGNAGPGLGAFPAPMQTASLPRRNGNANGSHPQRPAVHGAQR